MCKNSGFRSRIQKSYKKFGIESKNLIIFSESIPNLLPPPLASLGSHRSHRSHRLSLWVGNLTEALRSFASKGSHRFNEIQQEDGLWKFVLIRVRKSSQQNPPPHSHKKLTLHSPSTNKKPSHRFNKIQQE